MTGAAAAIAADRPAARAGLTVGFLAASLLCLFALDNLLLLHFWGLSLPLTAGLMVAACAAITTLSRRHCADLAPVPLRTFGVVLIISLMLFALGGEGRFFYANTDWQVRDAVLRDMATNVWPFAYDLHGTAYFLRAPLGTYLLPAMFGGHSDLALLFSNSLRLALLLTLAWHLFESKRERAITLAVFILFSGWDLVGTAIYSALGANLSWDHIERWNFSYQYSSHVTQAFWVPQHAIAGWACAFAFLLWRKGLVPIGFFAAIIPLVAIWSPLAILGAVPFAMFAGFGQLRRRAVTLSDIGVAALGLAIALPALLYLQIDAAKVGVHVRFAHPFAWLLCIALEVLPFAWPLLRDRAFPPRDRPVVLLILSLLIVMPLIEVGVNSDFQMRASIMPLALLSIYFAGWISRLLEENPARKSVIAYAVVAVLLGVATPLLELRRALVNPPSPRPLCSLVGVWNKQDNMIVPYSTYLAPVSTLPARLRHVPVVAGRSDPQTCWDHKWAVPEAPQPLKVPRHG
ncbi:MAG TPA: hypothetical protein VGQ34_12680 [Sphingomicrobium sp.]|jgi:hypothetical protein|nr:hypothetical protein [Sphingomicrobium sp.]